MGTVVASAADRREFGLVSDHELVAAVRSGDDRAFERLYERYHRRIAAYVYGMVNDYGRAEDITQDVFISALRRMRETERPIAFKPWVYEIAKNACIDQFRRSRRAEEVSYDAEEGAGALESGRLATMDAGPDDAVAAKQRLDHLCGAFGGLSDTHHQILVMRELEGLSYREIGEKMGLSRPSVESTLFRARRRLSEEYDELVSGERCTRVQAIILTAAGGALGARDQRRLLRHVAHCQPCRREARLAGVEVGSLSRTPARDAIAAKVAAILPFPFLLRGRRAATTDPSPGFVAQMSGPLSTMAEPIAGWTKAVAAAATILVAGAGAGAVSRVAADSDPAADEARAPAVKTTPAVREKRAADGRAARPAPRAGVPGRQEAASRKPAPAEGGAVAPDAGSGESAPQALIPSEPPGQAPDPTRLLPPREGEGSSPPEDGGGPTTFGYPTNGAQLAEELADTAETVDPRVGGLVGGLTGAAGGGG